jgi:hypothetical protein
MSNPAGTVQVVLQQIAGVLEPLQRELQPGEARRTLAELGIPLSAPQVGSLATPLQTLVAGVRDMLLRSSELTAAIDAENVSGIVSKSLALIEKIASVVQGFGALATALGGLGIPAATANAFPERLFHFLLVRALEAARGMNELLELLGILQREHHNEGSTDVDNPPYTLSTFRFDRVGKWLSSPTDVLKELYRWGNPPLDGLALLRRLESFLAMLGPPPFLDTASVPPRLDLVLLELRPSPHPNPQGLAARLRTDLSTGTLTFGQDDWKVELQLDFQLPFTSELLISPGTGLRIVPPAGPGTYGGSLGVSFIADRTAATEPYILLGQAGGSRLEARKLSVTTGGRFLWNGTEASGDFNIGGAVDGGRLFIAFDEADGFLGKLLSGVRLQSDFALGFGYSTRDGLYFTGSSTLEIQLPLHLSLGPVEVQALTLGIGIQGQRFPATFGTDIRAQLGPLQAVVEDIGLAVNFALKDGLDGNAGPLDVSLGFKPPKGVGLSLDAGVVKGGGYLYFDFEREEYAGALELSFAELVTVKAVGLITTRMPDGSRGFSLLIIISAEFTPLQLGFGFTLNAVGGLLGLNRTVRLDALRDGVRTGAINSILFPKDIVANAPKIISDLRAVFPPSEGKFLIGPMVKLGWGTPSLITLSLGLIIEIPGNIAILGVLKVALPADDAPLIVLQVNFVGTLDFDKKMLTFDASLFESRILFITLEGDMAVRLQWGDDPAFLLSVGGFHPSFQPPPLALPALRRLTASILDLSWARIRVEAYYAVTSNSVQWGSHAELYFGFDGLNVSGHIGYDVLFQFSPFYFNAQISGSLSLEVIGIDLLSIRLRFCLEGPAPWRARGTGSVSILFWDIDVDFDVTWGEEKNTTLPPIEVMPLVAAEVEKKDNWKALPPRSNRLLVSLRQLEPELLVLHPVGSLTVTQRSVPLALTLDKVGNQKPSDVSRVEVTAARSGTVAHGLTPVLESFAPAQFQQLSDAEKLSRPSYQKMAGGVVITPGGGELRSSRMTRRKVEYEVTLIDKEPARPVRLLKRLLAVAGLFTSFLRGGAVARSKLSRQYQTQLQPFSDKLAARPEGYTVAFTRDNTPFESTATFASEAMAADYLKRRLGTSPGLRDSLHVIPSYEVRGP